MSNSKQQPSSKPRTFYFEKVDGNVYRLLAWNDGRVLLSDAKGLGQAERNFRPQLAEGQDARQAVKAWGLTLPSMTDAQVEAEIVRFFEFAAKTI